MQLLDVYKCRYWYIHVLTYCKLYASSDYSLRMVINTGKLANVNSYETLMEASLGRCGFVFLSVSMFILSYGSMVAYLLIIKDVLPMLFHVTPHDIDIKRVIMFVSSLLVIVPLSMQRDMADLEKTSRLNVILDICLVLIVVAFAPIQQSMDEHGGILSMITDEPFLDLKTFFVGFGVCSFAFVCQDSSFIIAGSMKTPSKARWARVTNGAMVTCCILELIMGVSGYLAYTSNTVGNILNNMDSHHWSGIASRAMLSITMFFAYPMNLYIARHAFMVLYFEGPLAHEGEDAIVLMRQDRRVILTWALYILSLIPALYMESTGKILAVTGAVAGSSIAYICPGLAYLAIHSNEFIALIHKRWNVSGQKKLLGYPDPNSQLLNSASNWQTQMSIVSTFDTFIWYICGMPIWANIASIAQARLAEHFEKLDMASPSFVKPKRVSVVKSNWHPPVESLTNGEISSATALLQPNLVSQSQYGTDVTSSNNLNFTPLHRTDSLTSVEIRRELKNEDPAIWDFVIAISYIILGSLAMVLGLLSVLLM